MQKLLFLDTETTGLGLEDRLLQVAWKMPGETGSVCNFKPPVGIGFEAMAVHHVTEKMLEGAQSFQDSPIRTTLQALLENNIMVAHNAQFDKEMLEREGLTVPQFICTKKVAQALFDEPSYKMQFLRYKFGLEVTGEAHTADGDVAVLEAVFNYLMEANERIEREAGNEDDNIDTCIAKFLKISSEPTLLRRISFGKHKGKPFAEVPWDYLSWLKGDRAKNKDEANPDPDLDYTLQFYLNPKKQDESTIPF